MTAASPFPSDPTGTALQLQADDGSRALIHPQGAQVLSWTGADGRERLFLSRSSRFAPGVAIRGGVPVIFPQFAGEGPLPKHGFARNRPWTLLTHDAASARWQLQSDAASRTIWPQDFCCELIVTLGAGRLSIELQVHNTGSSALQFTAALHTYLGVDDIADVRVSGLRGLRYRDSAIGTAEFIEQAGELAIVGEVDRIYFDAPKRLELREPRRRLGIEQQGFLDTVVWNPGAQKAAALSDLEAGGEQRMLCIEAALIGRPAALAPGERWQGKQTLIA